MSRTPDDDDDVVKSVTWKSEEKISFMHKFLGIFFYQLS